jgi:small subunit ribosomal protein S1
MIDPQPLPVEPSEAYWQALLSQGEHPLATDTPTDQWPDPIAESFRPAPRGPVAPQRYPAPGAGVQEAVWKRLEGWFDEGHTFRAPVIGCNKGGLLVRVCDSIGFVPASQLADLPASLGTPHLRDDLEELVGQTLDLRLIELDPDRNRVICSERAVSWGDDDIDRRLGTLEGRIGEEIDGVVRSLCDFGAFVDLGGLDGLIHISELSWQRVNHPSDVLEVNDPVKVVVLNVDRSARRVALSLKRLRPDPWQLVGRNYAVGDVIDAVVTNVVEFGAFARVPEGIDGLIHISELADGPFFHPSNVVSEGQAVRVRVLHIDVEGRRLGLSLRQA